jgi:hypothetical protein
MTKPGARTADGEAPRAASADRIGTPSASSGWRAMPAVAAVFVAAILVVAAVVAGIAMPALFAMVASDYFAKKTHVYSVIE